MLFKINLSGRLPAFATRFPRPAGRGRAQTGRSIRGAVNRRFHSVRKATGIFPSDLCFLGFALHFHLMG